MKLIQVSPMGGVGNRMIQYMAALALAARVPGAQVGRVHLPEWGIQIAPVEPEPPRTRVVEDARLDFGALAASLNGGEVDCVDIRSYAQHVDTFLPSSAYRSLFLAAGPAPEGCGPDELLCNIRQGEILDARHPDYVLVPLDFYAELVERTGLAPVFCGQLDESPYMAALKRRFPAARFLPSQGLVADFERIRRSRNIVPAISTFSWLAAWLSDADRVFMPVLGLFHPLQSRSTNLLPLDDARFRFTLFPFHYAVPVADFASAHARLLGLWREMPVERLRPIVAAAPTNQDLAAHLAAFDEDFYLGAYPDVARAVAGGTFPSGRDHYAQFGFAERRLPCLVEPAWYCRTYPVAAFELAQGDWRDPSQHYVGIGRERGYRPREEGSFLKKRTKKLLRSGVCVAKRPS